MQDWGDRSEEADVRVRVLEYTNEQVSVSSACLAVYLHELIPCEYTFLLNPNCLLAIYLLEESPVVCH